MLSSKVIDKLLQNIDTEKYKFNPLLFEEVAEKVSANLCQTLASPSEDDNTELKKEIRKGIVKITKRLCKRKNSENVLSSHLKYDIVVKNLCLDKNNDRENFSKYNKDNHEIYDLLNVYSYENLNEFTCANNSTDSKEIELGIALTNMKSEICNKAVNGIVEKCLNTNKEFDKATLQFLRKVWESKNLLLSLELYDYLTVKLLYIFKEEILNIISLLADHDEDPMKDFINYENTVNCLLHESFPHFPILLERLANSSYVFCATFRLLSKMQIELNYNIAIEIIISLLLKNVKSRTASISLTHLYPQNLNSIVLLLDNNPDSLKSVFIFYTYVLESIKNLHENSQDDFVFLMSHYKSWKQHYSTNFIF